MSGRTLLIALTALGVVLSYAWLDGRYEQADHRKAKLLVRNLSKASSQIGQAEKAGQPEKTGQAGNQGASPKAAGSPSLSKRTLEDLLAERNPAARLDASWSSEMLSSCRGYVRVHAFLDNTDYAFDVDLVRHGVHPGNEAGKAVLAALFAQAPIPQDTAPAPVTPSAPDAAPHGH